MSFASGRFGPFGDASAAGLCPASPSRLTRPIRMRIPTLPPHIGWPLLVVSLLSISITASVYTLFAAQSDGGPEVVDNYYEKGARWDESQAARVRGDALTVAVDVAPSTGDARLRPVTVTVRDSTGQPVDGLRGTVRASRPQTAGVRATIPLSAADAPGTYRQMIPLPESGLWDFELDVTHAEDAILTTVRVDVAPNDAASGEAASNEAPSGKAASGDAAP